MKMNKNKGMLMSAGAIIFVLYNVALFLIAGFKCHGATFWVSYGAMMLGAIVATVAIVAFARSSPQMRDWFLGYPILRHATIYLVLEFIISTVFLILDGRIPAGLWVLAFLLQLVLLGFFAILVISCFFAKNLINDVRKEVKEKTTFMNMLQADAAILCDLCADAVAKKEFEAFSEAVKYSDPMSNAILASLEGEIQSRVMTAKMALNEGDLESALKACRQATVLLKERNLKCKALK